MQEVLFWLGLVIALLLVWVAGLWLRELHHNKNYHSKNESGLGDRLEKALVYLRGRGDITAKEYQIFAGISHSTAMRDLDELEKLGLIVQEGEHGRGVYYHVLHK